MGTTEGGGGVAGYSKLDKAVLKYGLNRCKTRIYEYQLKYLMKGDKRGAYLRDICEDLNSLMKILKLEDEDCG